MTKREYLISLGLAKPGRGRFSRAALAELARAEAAGTTFDEPAAPVKPATFDPIEEPTFEPEPEPVFEPVVSPKVRDIGESQLTGFTSEGWRVGFTSCRRCGLHANFCNCKDGLLAPSIVESLDERSLSVLGY
jgi:hypothetical protein